MKRVYDLIRRLLGCQLTEFLSDHMLFPISTELINVIFRYHYAWFTISIYINIYIYKYTEALHHQLLIY